MAESINNKTKPSRASNGVYLFHGQDDFSIKRKVDLWKEEFAKKYSASSIVVLDGEKLEGTELVRKLEEVLNPSLFSDKKLIICKNCLPQIASFIINIPKDYFLVFYQTQKLDRRLSIIKKFLTLSMTVQEFTLPHGREFDKWLASEVKRQRATIEQEALELLAVYLGRDLYEEKKAGGRIVETKEAFDLWQAASEVQKLASRSNQITVTDVQALVQPRLPQNIYELSDQILAGNKQQALKVLEQLLSSNAADEKSEIIRLVGLLAEQFRGILTVGSLMPNKSKEEIAALMGWTPGRVFINMKLAKSAKFETLQRYLGDLLVVDQKLKTSDVNPKLLLDMFIL